MRREVPFKRKGICELFAPGLPLIGGGGQAAYQIGKSLRFRSSATAYLARTPGATGSNTTFTRSYWVKRGTLGTTQIFDSAGSSSVSVDQIGFFADNTIHIESYRGAYQFQLITSQVFRDSSAWYEFVVAFDTTQGTAANRLKLYVNGQQVTSFSTASYPSASYATFWNTSATANNLGQQIASGSYSDLLFAEVIAVDGQQLTPSSFGQTDSASGAWIPLKYGGTYGNNGFYLKFDDASAATPATIGADRSGTNVLGPLTCTTSGTTALTAISGTTQPQVNQVVTGSDFAANTYLTAVGGISGAWTATLSTAATGSHVGTSATFTGNNWTPNNISVTAGETMDSLMDTPTNNWCVMSPVQNNAAAVTVTPSNGNLKIDWTGSWPNGGVGLTGTHWILPSSGKFYWEVTIDADTNQCLYMGLADETSPTNSGVLGYGGHSNTAAFTWAATNNVLYWNNATQNPGAAIVGDVIQVAYDSATGKFWIGNNGSWLLSGNPAAGTTPAGTLSGETGNKLVNWAAATTLSRQTATSWNFGQQGFKYTPPTGYLALNAANLPTPTIKRGDSYMAVNTRTGTGAAFNVTGQRFAPDLVWTKGRSGATDHALYDTVRGVQNDIGSNLSTAETVQAQGVTAFNSDGFSGGTLAKINTNAATYVDWMWRKSATAGLDIVTYTGNGSNRTIAHALGAVPTMIIIKDRSGARNWVVYHQAIGNGSYIALNSGAAPTADATAWNSTTPTSSVFSLGTFANVNTNTETYVAYVFTGIPGYSKAFSYTGNAAADGTFCYLGFRPRYGMFKNLTGGAFDWETWDSVRSTYNVMDAELAPNTAAAELSGLNYVDFVSNGMKMRAASAPINVAATIIGIAFAETPFKYSNAR